MGDTGDSVAALIIVLLFTILGMFNFINYSHLFIVWFSNINVPFYINSIHIFIFYTLGWYIISFVNGDAYPRVLKWTKKWIAIPPILAMILFGIIARNIHPYMDNYNDEWGKYIRMIWLVVILTRGGMELSFKGKGLTLLFLSFLPQLGEASTIAAIAYGLYDLPIYLCFSLGFMIGAISPGVVVPSCMFLQEKGYGIDKDIPSILIVASSFDDIIAITFFTIFTDVEFNKVSDSSTPPIVTIYTNIYTIITGVVIGLLIGALVGYSFKKLRTNKLIKLFIILTMQAVFIASAELSHFQAALYIWILMFSYMLKVFWGKEKPDKYLSKIWKYMQIFLFGTLGAAIQISKIEANVIPLSLIILVAGIFVRLVFAYICVCQQKYTFKERIVMSKTIEFI